LEDNTPNALACDGIVATGEAASSVFNDEGTSDLDPSGLINYLTVESDSDLELMDHGVADCRAAYDENAGDGAYCCQMIFPEIEGVTRYMSGSSAFVVATPDKVTVDAPASASEWYGDVAFGALIFNDVQALAGTAMTMAAMTMAATAMVLLN